MSLSAELRKLMHFLEHKKFGFTKVIKIFENANNFPELRYESSRTTKLGLPSAIPKNLAGVSEIISHSITESMNPTFRPGF